MPLDIVQALESLQDDEVEIVLGPEGRPEVVEAKPLDSEGEPVKTEEQFLLEGAALESMMDLINDSYTASPSVGLRVARMSTAMLDQSHGLESFGLESGFRINDRFDIEHLAFAVSGDVAEGNEGFVENLFNKQEVIAERRIEKLKELSSKISQLGNASVDKFNTKAVGKLHLKGVADAKAVMTGADNLLKASNVLKPQVVKAVNDEYIKYAKNMFKLAEKGFGKLHQNEIILTAIDIVFPTGGLASAILDVSMASDDPKKREATKFLNSVAKDWQSTFDKEVMRGETYIPLPGGKRFGMDAHITAKQSNSRLILLRLLFNEKSVHKVVRVSNDPRVKAPASDTVELPSKNELKAICDKYLQICEDSNIPESEYNKSFSALMKEFDDALDKDNLEKKFWRGNVSASKAAWLSTSGMGKIITGVIMNNLNTAEAAIRYLEDAVAAYDESK